MARQQEPAESIGDALHSLHRYYVASGAMRRLFRHQGDRSEAGALITLQLWYGTLYVVVEGWRQLGLHDDHINWLLDRPERELLRECRNTVFHYQQRYFESRFVAIVESPGSLEWALALDAAFGAWFSGNPWIGEAEGEPPPGFVSSWKPGAS